MSSIQERDDMLDTQHIQQHVQTVIEALEKRTLGVWWHYQTNNSVVSDHKDLIWGRKTIADCHTFDDAKLLANSPTWLQHSIEIIEQQQTTVENKDTLIEVLRKDNNLLESVGAQKDRDIEMLQMALEIVKIHLLNNRQDLAMIQINEVLPISDEGGES